MCTKWHLRRRIKFPCTTRFTDSGKQDGPWLFKLGQQFRKKSTLFLNLRAQEIVPGARVLLPCLAGGALTRYIFVARFD